MIYIEATEHSDFSASRTILVSIDEYKKYWTFQGPVYERYRDFHFGNVFLHFTDEGACERWLGARNRWNDAFDEQWNASFQRYDACEAIMQEATSEMESYAVSENVLDFRSYPKPALTGAQLHFLMEEAFARWQRYFELLKSYPSDNSIGFEMAEPELSKRFGEPVIWRNPLPFTIHEYLTYSVAHEMWSFIRFKKDHEQQDFHFLSCLSYHLDFVGVDVVG